MMMKMMMMMMMRMMMMMMIFKVWKIQSDTILFWSMKISIMSAGPNKKSLILKFGGKDNAARQ